MRTFSQTCGIGIVTLVLLTGVTTGAFGQGVGGGIGTDSAPSSAGPKGVIKLRATIICANCTLDEAKAAHPALSDLYELSHETGKVVLRVSTAKDTLDTPEKGEASPRWSSIGEPRQLSVRGEDRLFRTLVDPSNLAKEVELTGIIRTTRTLDLSGVTVLG